MQLLISTDLDGTLIDHHDYSFDAALPALEKCQRAKIPVVFNTSKNFAEARALQQNIGVAGPLIVENGAALIIDDQLITFGTTRPDILAFIKQFRATHGNVLEGFNDWSLTELISHTQLDANAAKLAMKKQYSEPFLWKGEPAQLSLLEDAAKAHAFSLSKGGRFYHLQGQCDKATPLKYLKSNAAKLFSGDAEVKLVCLGDNHNDVAMLEFADIAVCVKSKATPYPDFDTSHNELTVYTDQYGPKGWNVAINEILTPQP